VSLSRFSKDTTEHPKTEQYPGELYWIDHIWINGCQPGLSLSAGLLVLSVLNVRRIRES
jgi:hypothetical protein